MLGQTIAHYEIIEKLGEGGMGVVYKARDRNLDRFVAIKVLSTHRPGSSEEAARFEQEAKAISALNHPHIATIHDRGEVDGKPYLVLEYLPGGTLRDKLQQRLTESQPLTLKEILRYATEMAQGLAHAHRRGVVHRDVKTDNMMLTEEGSVKVTDFGLAKTREGTRITGGKQALGTAAYMSPEQGQGLEVDHRSDIFSFGVVLYELTTGQVPFQGMYPAAVVYDIINTPIPPAREARADIPEALEAIIQKATEKASEDRYQQMDELLSDLEALREQFTSGTGTGVPARRPVTREQSHKHKLIGSAVALAVVILGAVFWWSATGRDVSRRSGAGPGPATSISLAVLPLANLSNDESQDYLADGITEALITDLAKIRSLRVISRTSAMQYKNANKPLREIAGELNVNRIVEGTVLQVGSQIRITAQLIDATTDEHLWAESYQHDLTDVLALQQEVARAVAEEVQRQLAARDPMPLSATRSIDPATYEACVRGRIHAYEWTLEGAEKGIASYQRAIELDPDYAPAYAGLAMAYGFQSLMGGVAPGESWPRARAAAERALELDDTLVDAYTALGFVQASYDWNWPGAERLFQRALELNPSSSDAHHAYAMTCLAPLGRLDEALEAVKTARDLDPLSAAVNLSVAEIYGFRREYDRAIREFKHTIELDPGFSRAYLSLAYTYLAQGRRDLALEMVRTAQARSPHSDPFLAVIVDAVSGDSQQARGGLKGIEHIAQQRYICSCQIGLLYLLLDDQEKALESLERGFTERSANLMFLKVNPAFDRLRPDPRFQSLLRRMNLETQSRSEDRL